MGILIFKEDLILMSKIEINNITKFFFAEQTRFLEICKKQNFQFKKNNEKSSMKITEDCCDDSDGCCCEEEEINMVLDYSCYFSFLRLTLFFQAIIDAFYLKKNQKVLDKESMDLEYVINWLTKQNVVLNENEGNCIVTAVIFAQETNSVNFKDEFFLYDSENNFQPILTPEIIASTIETLVKIVDRIQKSL